MPTRDEWRTVLGGNLSDDEIDEFLSGLRLILNKILDEYLKEERAADL